MQIYHFVLTGRRLIERILTHSLLAVENMEVIMHTCSQQQVLLTWVPLESPNAPTNSSLTQGLFHIPPVPKQDVLIVAEMNKDIKTCI